MMSIEDNPLSWDDHVARMVDHIDSEKLPAQLVAGLSALISFSMATIFILRGQSRPICTFENFPESVNKVGIENFVGGTYVLNPAYRAHLSGIDQGVYRLRELAPVDYFSSGFTETHKVIEVADEEIDHLTEGWPRGFVELVLAVPIDDVTIEIDLYRRYKDGGFSQDDIENLSTRMPVIGAITRKFWQLHNDKLAPNPRDSSINDIYDGFGADVLTRREREVIQYVLRGHSSGSIALNLDISVTTIKTHRKRAYSKLNISSQSELFSMFLNCAKANFGSY
jgi:DNA-binding CsgD family transcriptional regulator